MREMYLWVPWFKELSQKIVECGEAQLAERARLIPWREDGGESPLLQHGDENVDPFSFVYLLARAINSSRSERRAEILHAVVQQFDLGNELPADNNDAVVFPGAGRFGGLFHNGEDFHPDRLWRLFRSAVAGVERVDSADFQAVLDIGGVAGPSLTQTLYLMNADEYLPAEAVSGLGLAQLDVKNPTWEAYRQALGHLPDLVPGCKPYEANRLHFELVDGNKVRPSRCWYISSIRSDGTDCWEDFSSSNSVFTDPQDSRLDEPVVGDVLLVHDGQQGRGVGVVLRNDYAENPSEDARLHVIWVNKSDTPMTLGGFGPRFGRATGGTAETIREAYPQTFQLLELLEDLHESSLPGWPVLRLSEAEELPADRAAEHDQAAIRSGDAKLVKDSTLRKVVGTDQWLVRKMPERQARVRVLTSNIQDHLLGQWGADVRLAEWTDGAPALAWAYYPLGKKWTAPPVDELADVKGVRSGFAADAWLGIRQADYYVDAEGHRPHAYRLGEADAMDLHQDFGGGVKELELLRSRPETARLYARVTDDDIREGVETISRTPDDRIRAYVRALGPPGSAEDLADTLIARKEDLVKRMRDETTKPGDRRPLNAILYGPPGTGKTFATVRRCVEICDGKAPEAAEELRERYRQLVVEQRIEFITFHQSYSYEEFVEGLRPTTQGESGGLELEVKDGVLKRIAGRARREAGSAERPVVKMNLSNSVLNECITTNQVLIDDIGDVDWSDPRFEKWGARVKALQEAFPRSPQGTITHKASLSWYFAGPGMRVGDIVVVQKGLKRFQAIGEVTGEYRFERRSDGYHHGRAVRWSWCDKTGAGDPIDRIGRGYDWSNHRINHWRPEKPDRVLRYVPGRQRVRPPNYVLVIDEINRANISKVLGELVTLLEDDKREGRDNEAQATLPYSQRPFTLPQSLHILGTMNTADRSIALIDTALRRRFDFEEVAPDPALLEDAKKRTGVDLPRVLSTINERIEYLLDRDHLIGHAWLMGTETRADVDTAMRRKIIPLLAEYFYEDWAKVRAVLGGNDAFVTRDELATPPGLDGFAETRYRWSVAETFPSDAYLRLV